MRLGMWMTSCLEAIGWGFWVIFEKKLLIEIWTETKRVDFRFWTRPGQLGLRDPPRMVGSGGKVSRVKIVSLSSYWKLKSEEGNKSFVPELLRVVTVSSVFRIPMHTNILRIHYITMHMNILQIWIFHIFVFGYVTYIYIYFFFLVQLNQSWE